MCKEYCMEWNWCKACLLQNFNLYIHAQNETDEINEAKNDLDSCSGQKRNLQFCIICTRVIKKHVDFCHNFSLDVVFHYNLVHIFGQQILLILRKNFEILQDILENNQQYVNIKWSHGARFNCVVYDIYTVDD